MRCYYNKNTKVFKHTCDVIEDYLCYFLTGIGSIALAVRFLTSLGSGEVVCAIKGEDFEAGFQTASLSNLKNHLDRSNIY